MRWKYQTFMDLLWLVGQNKNRPSYSEILPDVMWYIYGIYIVLCAGKDVFWNSKHIAVLYMGYLGDLLRIQKSLSLRR